MERNKAFIDDGSEKMKVVTSCRLETEQDLPAKVRALEEVLARAEAGGE
ncbi:MAG: hypothetical protein JXA49_05935 [Actinobacteria bacterium]|nr:hypothetical protein [Actinomycetota bacterium]